MRLLVASVAAVVLLRASIARADPPLVTASAALPPTSRRRVVAPIHSDTRGLVGWLHPHLDESRRVVGADRARHDDGVALTGRGVVLGVIDTGFDLAHPDLVGRVAWAIDYAQPPAGLHPELEARFAVATDTELRGAVFARDELSRAGIGDPSGHGTHALSIALGGDPSGRYVGIAPEATGVVVRASLRADRAEVPEATVAAGAGFVFERAAALGMPAVVSLSLGTQHGAHDGDAPLERTLAALLRDGDAPGRALVASAGNGGGRALHARAVLASGATTALALRVSSAGVVGVSVAYTGALSVAVQWPDGVEGARVPTGVAAASRNPRDGTIASVANATDGASPTTGARLADVLLEASPGVYTLLLRGEGRAEAWVFLDGDARTREAPVFLPPYGDDEASVEVPSTSAAVVAVGARATRVRWIDARGVPAERVGVRAGEVAPFSARGSSWSLTLKPDLLAPGDGVVAALASQARLNPNGDFADEARYLDATHAITSGTSAAAPHVAGALALLFEAHPEATQRALLAALTASSSPWSASEGWADLDIPRALALLRASVPLPASPARSRCAPLPERLIAGERVAVTCRLLDATGAVAVGNLTLDAPTVVTWAQRDLGAGRRVLHIKPGVVGVGTRVPLAIALDGATLARWNATLSAGPGTDMVAAAGGCSVANHRRIPRQDGLLALLLVATARGVRTSLCRARRRRVGIRWRTF